MFGSWAKKGPKRHRELEVKSKRHMEKAGPAEEGLEIVVDLPPGSISARRSRMEIKVTRTATAGDAIEEIAQKVGVDKARWKLYASTGKGKAHALNEADRLGDPVNTRFYFYPDISIR